MNQCPKCGGALLGDGYTMTVQCEYADPDDLLEVECDAGPILCKFEDDDQ